MGVLNKIYSSIINTADPLVPQNMRPLWMHPAGPKTIFFWAPLFKWGLVIAGIADLARPADRISVAQAASIAATGFIWSRYSLVIIPKNWALFSVNIFVGLTQSIQLARAILYQMEQKKLQAEKTK